MTKAKPLVKYIKMLLPAVLIAILIGDAIFAYKAPDLSKYKKKTAVTAAAAVKKPSLKTETKRKKKHRQPAGTSSDIGRIDDDAEYKDGDYTGSAKGFGGIITVRVSIRSGKISNVKILSADGEDEPYFSKAKKLTGIIAKKNSANVDTVSGATYSSNGIIMAVRNALSKAAIKKKSKSKKSGDSRSAVSPHNKKKAKKPAAITGGKWKDGTYQGKGEGFGGELKAIVIIKNGKIFSITIGDNSEDKEYLTKAKDSVIPSIIKKQGTDVDTVSGATYSSKGIIEAVNDALKKAAVKNSSKNKNVNADRRTAKNADSNSSSKDSSKSGRNDEKKNGGNDGRKAGDNDDKSSGADSSVDGRDEQADDQNTSILRITKTMRILCDENEDFDDYDLLATFRIEGGKVTAILDVKQVVPESGNDAYIKAALLGIRNQMKTKPDFQGIDTVSGATCTSLGLIEGGKQALSEAAGK